MGVSFHRGRAGGVLVHLSEAVRGLHAAVAIGVGNRGHGGELGAVAVGILAFHEPVTAPRLLFVGLLLAGIVGLKLTA